MHDNLLITLINIKHIIILIYYIGPLFAQSSLVSLVIGSFFDKYPNVYDNIYDAFSIGALHICTQYSKYI